MLFFDLKSLSQIVKRFRKVLSKNFKGHHLAHRFLYPTLFNDLLIGFIAVERFAKFPHVLFVDLHPAPNLLFFGRFEVELAFHLIFAVVGKKSKSAWVWAALTAQLAVYPLYHGMTDQMIFKAADPMHGVGNHHVGLYLVYMFFDNLLDSYGIHLLKSAVGQVEHLHPGESQDLLHALHFPESYLSHFFFAHAQAVPLFGSLSLR